MVDKNKAVVCCLLATSAIMLSQKKNRKRKTWSRKWYLKRNMSFGAYLLNEFLETGVEDYKLFENEMMLSWCRQVNWGNCGIPWVNCAVLCVKGDWKGQFWGLRYYIQNSAVYSVFPSGMTLHSKIAQFNWVWIAPFREVMYVSVIEFERRCLLCFHTMQCYMWVLTFWSGMLSGLGRLKDKFRFT
jgi:hypothetical protein